MDAGDGEAPSGFDLAGHGGSICRASRLERQQRCVSVAGVEILVGTLLGAECFEIHISILFDGVDAMLPGGRYSGMATPEPPSSAGKSFSLGRPSFIGSTVSA